MTRCFNSQTTMAIMALGGGGVSNSVTFLVSLTLKTLSTLTRLKQSQSSGSTPTCGLTSTGAVLVASFAFARVPRRADPNAALVVQKNLEDFMTSALDPVLYHPPEKPRRDDKLSFLVVQRNLADAVDLLSLAPFFFPYAPRRNDPHAALVVQKNLEALVKAV